MEPDLVPAPEVVDAFRRDGHVALPGLVPPDELPEARRAARRLVRRALPRLRAELGIDVDGGGPLPQYLPLIWCWQHDEVLRRLVLSPRLARVAATLLGVDGVRLYYDELFVKLPGAPRTSWHQDQVYWPLDTSDVLPASAIGVVRLWVTLTDLPAERGGIRYVSGSHRRGPVERIAVPHPSRDGMATVDGRRLPTTAPGHLRAGDATAHAGYTLHGAQPNRTDHPRFGLAIAYVPDGTRVGEPCTDPHDPGLDDLVGGRRPGERLDGPTNPRLWPAAAVEPASAGCSN